MEKDIYLGADFDLTIRNGDFYVYSDLEQRVASLSLASKGHYKQWPLLGASTVQSLNASTNRIVQAIRLNLEADGLRVKQISYVQGNIEIHAEHTT
jgi:hypothetical protein